MRPLLEIPRVPTPRTPMADVLLTIQSHVLVDNWGLYGWTTFISKIEGILFLFGTSLSALSLSFLILFGCLSSGLVWASWFNELAVQLLLRSQRGGQQSRTSIQCVLPCVVVLTGHVM